MCLDSKSLIPILIPGLKSLIQISIPIPLYFDIFDSDSNSSKYEFIPESILIPESESCITD